MNGRRPAHPCSWGTLVTGACVVGLVACGGHSGAVAPPSSPSTAASATTSSVSAAARRAALTAYDGMWADEQEAALTADYQSQLLAAHASGAALSVLVRGLYSLRLQHLVIKGQPVTHPTVTSLTPAVEPTTAALVDCLDDTHWLVYKDGGGLQDNVPGGHRRVTATVADAGGVWKVTELDTGAEGTC